MESPFYVPQGAYAVGHPGPGRLYADGATSCIVALVTGHDAQGRPTALLAHLDTPEATQRLFGVVLDRVFAGPVSLWARGASPPDLPPSMVSVAALVLSVAGATEHPWSIDNVQLELGEKSPGGWLGVDLETMQPLAQPLDLGPGQRDPLGGPHTLMAMNRWILTPPVPLWDVSQPLTDSDVEALVAFTGAQTAVPGDHATRFLAVLEQDDLRILTLWSTTPRHEPPWFCDQLRQAAAYVKARLSASETPPAGA